MAATGTRSQGSSVATPVGRGRPQDDFYRYVNATWLDEYVLPPHRAEASMLSLLGDKVQDEVVALIRAAGDAVQDSPAPGGSARNRRLHHGSAHADSADRWISGLYASFMDTDAIERRGAAALAGQLRQIADTADHNSIAAVMGRMQARGVAGALRPAVAVDTMGDETRVLVLGQAGLGLPAAANYGDIELRAAYVDHVGRMLSLAGVADSTATARTVVDVETQLAVLHEAPDAQGRFTGQPLRTTAGRLRERSGFPWTYWLHGLGDLDDDVPVIVRQPRFATGLDSWWPAQPLSHLRAWQTWLYVHEMAPFGPAAVFEENFDFYGRRLTGSHTPRPRWMRATSLVQTVAGTELGRRYLDRHLPPGTVPAAKALVDELVAAFRRCLANSTWMTAATRDAAIAKLDAMVVEIGSPAPGDGPDAPPADPVDLIGNVLRARHWYHQREIAKLGAPADRSDWQVPPQAVTAYYRHGLNQVVIPAALLQPPVFDPHGDAAMNFAVFGSIVCHEMSHAFDDRGADFDGHGRLRNWWSAEDRAEFARRAAVLVTQYGAYVPTEAPDLHVDGHRTLGENIADVIGLTVARAAFAAHLAGRGETGERARERMRRFFEAWGSMWRCTRRAGRLRERLASDRHAPAEFRCNGAIRHVPAFYEVFDVRPGDPMYLEPTARFGLA